MESVTATEAISQEVNVENVMEIGKTRQPPDDTSVEAKVDREHFFVGFAMANFRNNCYMNVHGKIFYSHRLH